jgi:DNA modification methylase
MKPYYETENGKLYCGDYSKIIDTIKYDLLYTDPPYLQMFQGGGSIAKKYLYRKKSIKKISNFNPKEFLSLLQKNKAHGYIWASKNLLDVYIKWFKDNKYSWDILIWDKINPIPAYNNSYLSNLEFCLFYRGKNCYFNNNLKYKDYFKTMRDNVAKNTHGHPTQKYLWMVIKAIRVSSQENETIFDPFMGSGTTAVACERYNRKWIGCEISKEYCDIAIKRIKQEREQLKLSF